jgi:hypothetical protein
VAPWHRGVVVGNNRLQHASACTARYKTESSASLRTGQIEFSRLLRRQCDPACEAPSSCLCVIVGLTVIKTNIIKNY